MTVTLNAVAVAAGLPPHVVANEIVTLAAGIVPLGKPDPVTLTLLPVAPELGAAEAFR